jgi:hypothetical protein
VTWRSPPSFTTCPHFITKPTFSSSLTFLQWVAFNRDDVGVLACRDRAGNARHAKQVGGVHGRRFNRISGCHPVLDHERELLGILAMGAHRTVGAEGDLHAFANGAREALFGIAARRSGFFELRGGECASLPIAIGRRGREQRRAHSMRRSGDRA